MKKTILITGSTDGIGKLAALKLAKEGHEVYLHGRNSTKLASVISEVKEKSNNENISGFTADFSDLKLVKKMSQEVKEALLKIDVLINNAGVFKSPEAVNQDNLDLRFVVNYLAPYLLSRELMPLLKMGNEPRIINVSSDAQAPISLEALAGKSRLSEQEAYAQSKLALTMWSFHLAKTHQDISTIAVNPGSLLNTNMVKEAYGYHWSAPDKGGNILYDLAISEEYKDKTGLYFDNDKGEIKGKFGKALDDAYNGFETEKLIKITEIIVTN